MLAPSGILTNNPYHMQASDIGAFHMHNKGTHHNIVSPGTGVGVHTVRPDKSGTSPTKKTLRSLYFKEKG